jgi:hypothetical protein
MVQVEGFLVECRMVRFGFIAFSFQVFPGTIDMQYDFFSCAGNGALLRLKY